MNYSAHYDRLIARARGRTLTGYRERHHVVPKCMGGGDESQNIVALTAEEHYVAHQLLVKIYPNVKKLAVAAALMARRCSGNKPYGWLRRRHAAENHDRVPTLEAREKMAAVNRGRAMPGVAAANRGRTGCKHSEEARARISAALRGKVLSAETRRKISAAKYGRATSEETRKKLSEAGRGRAHSEETKAKIKASLRTRFDRTRHAQ